MRRLSKSLLPLWMTVPLTTISGCGASRHSPDEKYFLIATNVKIPYWQAAQAGLVGAGASMKVRTELAGPDTYDTKAQHEEFQRVLKMKPTGILISAGDSKLIQPDIDAAIAQGVPVITVDSDVEGSGRLLFIGTDNYKAGTQGGELVARALNGTGNVVVYTMPSQANLYQRLHGSSHEGHSKYRY
jgi:ribose transport system substrate-binding protein